jgi:capsular exopolysaccharide synthesis family protein
MKFTLPVYETKASVLIKDEKKGEEESKMEEVLNVFGSKKIVENEQEILRSNSVINEVVRNQHLYAAIEQEKGWKGLKIKPAFISFPLTIEAKNPADLKKQKKTYFTYNEETKTVVIGESAYKINEWFKIPAGEIRFTENPNYGKYSEALKEFMTEEKTDEEEEVKFFFTIKDIKTATAGVIGNLNVIPSNKQSSVINISYKDPIPERAEKIIEEIVRSYNKSSIERKNQVALKTLQFIDERLNHVSKELDSVEKNIQKYRNTSGIVDIGEQSKMYLESIGSNDQQMNTINLQLSSLNEIEKNLSVGKETIAPGSLNMQDPALNNLLDKYYSNQSQYEKLRKTNGENFPAVAALREEIEKTKPLILENVRNQKKNLEAGRGYLSKTSNKYSSMLNSIPKKERELVEVSRQQNIKNGIYTFLLQKKEEISYSISSIIPECYMVSNPTTSPNPISPKKLFVGLICLMIPILFILGILILKENINHKILYRSDIEKYTDYPILGEVVYEKFDSPVVTGSGQRSFVVEQFRQIRSVLKHQMDGFSTGKRILVTSSIKGDGKSFVSGNLAVSFARSGKKVALLEMDLHQPRISEMFTIPQNVGITDYLIGQAKPENIILKSSKHENLSILPCGFLEEDPTELLTYDKLETLFSFLDKRFDIIIIDTAPFKALTDAYIIGAHCNLVMVVVRHDHTPTKILERINEDMESQEINNVAIVFNGVKNRGMGKFSYGYGYGYGYDQKSNYNEYYKKSVRKSA